MRFIWLIILSAVFAGASEGQDVQALVGDVTDTRVMGSELLSSGRGGCEVEVRLVGDGTVDTFGIRAARVRVVTDDTGRELRLAPVNPQTTSTFIPRIRDGGPVSRRVRLKNPARTAKLIKVLEGELDLYQPTLMNGGKVVISNFQSRPGELIEAPELKKLNVQLIYATPETEGNARRLLEEAAPQPGAGEKAEEAVRRIAFRRGTEATSAFQNLVKVLVNDPEKRLVEISFVDEAGIAIETRGHSRSGSVYSFGFERSLPKDAQLVVFVTTPAAIKTVPFKLENVPLP